MNNILIAIDSFKGSLTTNELATAIEDGILHVSPNYTIKKVPIADGGEGTYQTLVDGLGGKTIEVAVKDPLFNPITAEYGIINDTTAIIEMATSSGLPLVPLHQRNPLFTTTYGVGQMIADALNRGIRDFIIGIGGSATNDAGMGMLEALGFRFYNAQNEQLLPIGQSLNKINHIDISDIHPKLQEATFLVACDVDNPLYGEQGAAYIYGPQKGASKAIVEELDQGLRNFSTVVYSTFQTDVSKLKGAGAAGGLGAAFKAFLHAELQPGVDIIFNKLNMDEYINWADIVITGEGKLDYQTVMGKAPMGIARLASQHNLPVIAIAGSVDDNAQCAHDHGVTAMFSIMDSPMTLDQAMDSSRAKILVTKQVEEIFRLIHKFKK